MPHYSFMNQRWGLEILDFFPTWLVGIMFYFLLVFGAAIGRWWRSRISREGGEGDASLVMSASLDVGDLIEPQSLRRSFCQSDALVLTDMNTDK
jgi:hypothetical protein